MISHSQSAVPECSTRRIPAVTGLVRRLHELQMPFTRVLWLVFHSFIDCYLISIADSNDYS